MSNPLPIIVIFGVTGKQGSGTANALLKYFPDRFQLRGVTRNPSSASASAWVTKGVEIVQGDMGDVESVRNAIQDAYGVFFYQTLEFNEKCYENEMNHARAFGEICKDVKIQHLIYSSVGDSRVPEAQHVPLIHNKALIENMFRHELKLPVTFVNPTAFMENFVHAPDGNRNARFFTISDDGVISTFQPADTKTPWVNSTDIGKVAAVTFANQIDQKDNIGNDTIIVSNYLSGNELAEICTKVYGKPFTYKVNPGLPQLTAYMPDLGKMFQHHIDHLATADVSNHATNTAQLLESVGGVTSFETWLRQNSTTVLLPASN